MTAGLHSAGFLTNVLHRVAAIPWVYDRIQILVGVRRIHARLAPHIARMDLATVVDIGAGTGLARALVPPTAKYVWLDIDRRKLQGFREKKIQSSGLLVADAVDLCLRDKSVDYALCLAILHHLSDAQLRKLISELARVVRCEIVFMDPLDRPESLISRLLWRYDRGSAPRSSTALLDVLAEHLDVLHTEEYQLFHRYLVCVARPRKDRRE